ncbi:hypothetical protein NDU88_001160 [Pleurodeles waltl]|uniref:Uncharacterized protein n=1 Tax=Pleurodeles waltl TaxID=8319 RepID=A0AAV7RC10_PLEWA|nr:hypothetical protein NDU88_001160 [Pleurodeles waltl]
MEDVYLDDRFVDLSEQPQRSRLSPVLSFTCMRLRAALRKHYPTFPQAPPGLRSLLTLLTRPTRMGFITVLYEAAQVDEARTNGALLDEWNAMLDTPLTESEWTFCSALIGQLTANGNLRIIHLNFLQHMHYIHLHSASYLDLGVEDNWTTGSQIAQQKQESDVRRPLDPLDAIAEERIEGEEGHSIAGTARRENPGPTLRPVPLLGDASIASFNMPDDDEYYNEAHDYDGPYSSDQDYDYENPDPTLSPATLLSDASIASFNMPDDDEYYNEAHDYDGPYSSDQDYDYENPEPTVSPATLLSDASIASFNMADDDDEQYYNETHDYDGPYSSDEDDDDFIFLSTHW